MFDTLHLTNMLRLEVESIPETGLPLDAFPDKIQEIILNLARYENFNVKNIINAFSILVSSKSKELNDALTEKIKELNTQLNLWNAKESEIQSKVQSNRKSLKQ